MEYHDGAPLQHADAVLSMGAHRYGEKDAIVSLEYGEAQSFAALDERASRVASALTERGVGAGDRVGLFLPNTLQFPETFFGAMRAGAIPVPLNLRMDVETLGYICSDADVDHLVTSPLLVGGMETDRATVAAPADIAAEASISTRWIPGMGDPDGDADGVVDYDAALEAADPDFDPPERDTDDVAVQTYTSGTTGRPKGVLLSHRNLLSVQESMATSGPSPDPGMTGLMVLPLFHVPTLNTVMGKYLYTGGTVILQARPSGEGMLQAIAQFDINEVPAVPALHTMMYRAYSENPDAYDVSSVEALGAAAAPLPDDTKRNLTRDFDVSMSEGWGMTETAGLVTLRSPAVNKAAGCIGQPLRNLELELRDADTRETVVPANVLNPRSAPADLPEDEDARTGEIAVRGPQVFEGYHGLPETNEQVFDDEGWFHTEDVGRVDEDGHLWIVDRADDMIIAGGENIYPAEVEDALYDHPDIAEAAVVAAPHEVKGEAPVAFVVPEPDADLDERTVREYSLENVASYAHPRRVFFVDELPRSATQKVQRYKLEEQVEAELGGEPLASSEQL
jgi:long-chain acyl-CoA synthetase